MSQEARQEEKARLEQLLKRRNVSFDLKAYMQLKIDDHQWQQEQQALQEQRNKFSKAIGQLKAKGEDASATLAQMSAIKASLEELKTKREQASEKLATMCDDIPGELDPSVPDGRDEADNQLISQWGKPKAFDFPIKDHIEVAEALMGLDLEKAVNMSRSRFVVLQGAIAALHRALATFMLDVQTQEHGYTEINPPLLVNQNAFHGAGQWPKFKDDLFFMKDEDLGLIPTSEVALVNLIADTLIDANQLPYKWVSHTPCFRKEAGSYGKDTKGMIRQHQFEKVELVQVVKADEVDQAHEAMCQHSQTILERLELPYQKVLLCSGDTGFHARKTFDLEVWIPSQNTYREIASISQCGDFQAKRLKARAKDLQTGQKVAIHTLNGSALAVGRTLIAFLENHQQANGGLYIPKVLEPYLHKNTLNILKKH